MDVLLVAPSRCEMTEMVFCCHFGLIAGWWWGSCMISDAGMLTEQREGNRPHGLTDVLTNSNKQTVAPNISRKTCIRCWTIVMLTKILSPDYQDSTRTGRHENKTVADVNICLQMYQWHDCMMSSDFHPSPRSKTKQNTHTHKHFPRRVMAIDDSPSSRLGFWQRLSYMAIMSGW